MTPLFYPQARLNIICALESLADPANQQRSWISGEMPELGKTPNLYEVFNLLFYDTGLDEGVETCIGYMLYDKEEASRIDQIMERIDQLYAKYGVGLPDKDYVSKPEWPDLVADARSCLELFERNDRKYGVATG